MNQVYSKKEYIIIRVGNGFIIINTAKEFHQGHTHIKSFNTGKYLIDLSINKGIPHHLNPYLLISLIRISSDPIYTGKIEELLKHKRTKQTYYNRSA